MKRRLLRLLNTPQFGLTLVILVLATILTIFAGTHPDRVTGQQVNNFLNLDTLMDVATNASSFAIMAVGMALVIISGGIDLSVGSIYAVCGVAVAMFMRAHHQEQGTAMTVVTGALMCVGIGVVCGLINGVLITLLDVHPFIITLGTMWVYRGIAFVISQAESILMPASMTAFAKANLGLPKGVYPVPMLTMVLVSIVGALYLCRTVSGRRIFALGGNRTASQYSGLKIAMILAGVYVACGLTAGIASFVGNSFYGAASCGDATGYELYVIASAVVGGCSLAGGKGDAICAMLGALLIALIRQAIRTLHFDQNYESIIVGVAIVIAVVIDRMSARIGQMRLAQIEQGSA